jgi:hypothetical protein
VHRALKSWLCGIRMPWHASHAFSEWQPPQVMSTTWMLDSRKVRERTANAMSFVWQ